MINKIKCKNCGIDTNLYVTLKHKILNHLMRVCIICYYENYIKGDASYYVESFS